MATPEQIQQNMQNLETRTTQLENQLAAAVERERVNSQTMIGYAERVQRLESLVSDASKGMIGDRVSRLEGMTMDTGKGHSGKEKNLTEYRVITGIPTFSGAERGPYKEWQTKVLNALIQVRKGIRVVLEKAGKQATEWTTLDYQEVTAGGPLEDKEEQIDEEIFNKE